jgi:kynurenine formamidase
MNEVRVIDLSLKISQSLKVFPGSPQPCFVPWTSFSKHGYDSEALFMSTHTGTHMDAPSHFVPGRPSIDRVVANRFVAEAVVVRIPKKLNELVEASDLKDQEIKANDAVVIATGWEKKIRARNYMTENPGLSASAARFLVRKKVSIVAIDGPSIDAGADAAFTAHKILLSENILVVENLCNLNRISMNRFLLVVAPLKIQGSTGSPVRALAVL